MKNIHRLALCTFVCMEGGETHGAWSRVLHWYRLHNGVAEKGSLSFFRPMSRRWLARVFLVFQKEIIRGPTSRVLTRPTHSRLFPNEVQKTISVTK